MDALVRCTLKAISGVPEHDCVNTFAVQQAASDFSDADEISDAFAAFYNEIAPEATRAIGEYINSTIKRTLGLQIELVADPLVPPNPSYNTQSYDLVEAEGAVSMPQEVACCLSFVDAIYGSSLNPGRHRGRVYIGPLNNSADTEGVDQVCRPDPTFQADLCAAAIELESTLHTGFRRWAFISRADAGTNAVVGGWVDDEFDTQRRRGRDRTARTFWSA